ncbi:SH3 domain-containing protein [Planomicrobium sp. Y74]|uniref:SH3 domain-containing protein n=1 Tax=Planomicrobium sp. Y74 TaxID=2478977 RepID=UPI001314B57C|nr:SH3 domain-containing protein [Planomicrobium sp. Y74]
MGLKQSQKTLETFFLSPNDEYQYIESDLKKRLLLDVHEEIIAYVQVKTDEAMDKVWGRLKKRYVAVSELDETMPKKPTAEDRSHYLKEFFKLTNPEAVSKDLQEALKFDKMEVEYKEFIKQMKLQEYGELFVRYLYPSNFFNSLKRSILTHIDKLVASLKRFTDAIAEHAWTLDDIRKENKENAFIRGGASVLGMLVGIPFAGAGIGALMGNSSKERVQNSLQHVFDGWNKYIDDFNWFYRTLETNYRLAMMTIYGGTLLRVNDQLGTFNYTFESMALLSCKYSVTLTEKERRDTEKWLDESTRCIKQLINRRYWQEALRVSIQLFNIIKERPVLARAELSNNTSPIYIASKYHYLSFQEALLEEYKNGHSKDFFATAYKLYEELPLLIQDKDLEPGFSKQGELLFRFIKQALKEKNTEALRVIPSYLSRVSKRWETEGYYVGEYNDSIRELLEQSKAFFLAEVFLEDVLDITDDQSEEESGQRLHLTVKQLKELKKVDASIGQTDMLTKYIQSQYIKSFLFPWRNISFDWMAKYRKMTVSFVLAILLLVGGFSYGPHVYDYSKEKVSSIELFFAKQKESREGSESIPVFITLTVDYANIREIPSLDGAVVTTVGSTDEIQYLNEDQTDSRGTVWHKVSLTNGYEGWISGAITSK